MSAAVAAGVLLLARRIIWCFSWKEKSVSKTLVRDTVLKITKNIDVFRLAFSLQAYSLSEMNEICAHACMWLGLDPKSTWISALSVISHKIHKPFYTPQNDPNQNFTTFTKQQQMLNKTITKPKPEIRTKKPKQWAKQVYKWRREYLLKVKWKL